MKLILKNILIVLLIICILLPTLFSGVAFAAESVPMLTTERAGNYVSNFAINFFENWSSISVEQGSSSSGSSNSSGTTSSKTGVAVVDAGQRIFDEILLGNKNIIYIPNAGRDSEQIVNDKTYLEKTGVDCTTFVSAALWLAGYEQFASTIGSSTMIDRCKSGEFISYGFELYRTDGTNVYKWNESSSKYELLSGVTPYETLQPGDVIVVQGHANIVKEVLPPTANNKYIALDCGSTDGKNWQDISYYESQGNGVRWDCWTDAYTNGIRNWSSYGCTEAYLMRATNATSAGSSSSTQKAIIRGEVVTEYDENATVDSIEEGKTPYKFSNKSWIDFVFKYALKLEDLGYSNSIAGDSANENIFDNEEILFGEDLVKESDIIDISRLISEGQILPGDILYVTNGMGSGEFVLYVGGTKIIYATKPTQISTQTSTETSENSDDDDKTENSNTSSTSTDMTTVNRASALKYEYIEYYLQRIKRNLIQENEKNAQNDQTQAESDLSIPKYGVTKIYRIKESVANQIPETSANLIFSNKGYYSYTEYQGIPDIVFEGTFEWKFDGLAQLFKFLANLIIYMVRMQVVGWVNLVENIIQNVVLGISGHNEGGVWDAIWGTNATSASGDRITVESIFFNQIPILDANFFDFEKAGGRDLVPTVNTSDSTESTQENTNIEVPDDASFVYQLRSNLNKWYVIIRNLSIALLLFVLIYLGIRLAISVSAEKKAEYKKLLTAWLTAFIVVIFLHLFMYLVFTVNETLVGVCRDLGQTAAQETLENDIGQSQEEMNLYDAVRTKAYIFDYKQGVPATVIYVYLVYLLIRFLFIYLKRYLTIYILAISGAFMGVKYAIEKIGGKKTGSLNKWFKDFSFNVLLQTVHAFIYVLFMAVALSVASTSLGGFCIALTILNFMLKADKIIVKIFGLDKAGSLADVSSPESWIDMAHKFFPIYTVSKMVWSNTKGFLFGKRGLITEARYFTTGKDNYDDAEKELQKRKYQKIGNRARRLHKIAQMKGIRSIVGLASHTPLKHLAKYSQYKRLLGNNLSPDTNKRILNSINKSKELNRKRYTRRISTVANTAFGAAGMVASIGVAIADPVRGMAMFATSKKRIDNYRTTNKSKYTSSRYGISKAIAKNNKKESARNYNQLMDKYVDNQFEYEQKIQHLKDTLNNENDEAIKDQYRTQIKELEEERAIKEAEELHELQEAYEEMKEKEKLYEMAKHERNLINKPLKGMGMFIGANVIEDIATNQSQLSYKDWEKATKEESKLKDLQKVAELEQELRQLNKEFKEELKKYSEDTTRNKDSITETQIPNIFNGIMSVTTKEAKNMNISSRTIKDVVSTYMYKNRKTKVKDTDVDAILDDLQNRLKHTSSKTSKSVEFTTDVKEEVKKQIKDSMISDSKGLGYDSKDATTIIRKTLGQQGVLKTRSIDSIKDDKIKEILKDNPNVKTVLEDDRILEKYEQIIQKIKDINTYDEIGKVKYKESLISINKILKEAKKQ